MRRQPDCGGPLRVARSSGAPRTRSVPPSCSLRRRWASWAATASGVGPARARDAGPRPGAAGPGPRPGGPARDPRSDVVGAGAGPGVRPGRVSAPASGRAAHVGGGVRTVVVAAGRFLDGPGRSPTGEGGVGRCPFGRPDGATAGRPARRGRARARRRPRIRARARRTGRRPAPACRAVVRVRAQGAQVRPVRRGRRVDLRREVVVGVREVGAPGVPAGRGTGPGGRRGAARVVGGARRATGLRIGRVRLGPARPAAGTRRFGRSPPLTDVPPHGLGRLALRTPVAHGIRR